MLIYSCIGIFTLPIPNGLPARLIRHELDFFEYLFIICLQIVSIFVLILNKTYKTQLL